MVGPLQGKAPMDDVGCRCCGFSEPAEARVGSGSPGRCDACDAHARLGEWVAGGCREKFSLDPSLDVVRMPDATQEFLSVASRAWALAAQLGGEGGDAVARCVSGADALSSVLCVRTVTGQVMATNPVNRAGIAALVSDLRVVVARPARNVMRAWARAGTLEGLTVANIESTGGYNG